jgi:flagellar basal-body rod protein FlgC
MSIDASSVALSGVAAAATRMRNSAHNIANLQTNGFHPHETVLEEQEGGGVKAVTRADPQSEGTSLGKEFIEQQQAREQFEASLRVIEQAAQLTAAFLGMPAASSTAKGQRVDRSA